MINQRNKAKSYFVGGHTYSGIVSTNSDLTEKGLKLEASGYLIGNRNKSVVAVDDAIKAEKRDHSIKTLAPYLKNHF